MMTRLGVVAALLAVLTLSSACGGGGSGDGADDDVRAQVDAAGTQVRAALDDLVPVLQARLRAELTGGTTSWESCTSPVTGDVAARARLQFGPTPLPPAATLTRTGAALRDAGWTVQTDPLGSISADRDGLNLRLDLQGQAQTVTMSTACVKTSAALDREYAQRPAARLPVPWRASGG